MPSDTSVQNQGGPSSERRASPRRKLEVGIGLHSDSQIFVGYSEDFSDGGVFVATQQRLPPGSHVTLDIELPTGARVSCGGRVAWVRESSEAQAAGLGIAFDELTSADREALTNFTRERPPLFYDLDAL